MYNKNKKHIAIACGLYIKIDYPDILEDKFESYSVEDIFDWFISRVNYYNKLFKDIFEINIPLNEDTITPLTTEFFYCRENLGNEVVRDHDHLNGKFRGYAHNKSNLQAKKYFCTDICI